MAEERKNVTFSMTADELEFLTWAMRFLRGGPHDYEKELERWEAIFTQSIGKYFEELPAHAMTDDGYKSTPE
jgi:hypothetical protein